MWIVAQEEYLVDNYVDQYLYQPLKNPFPLPGFTRHEITRHEIESHLPVRNLLGEPDFVATALNLAGQQQLLFVAASKTRMTFFVPSGSTTAEAWQDPDLRSCVSDAVQQVYGYMLHNRLRYSMLTNGESFVFMQRIGTSLWLADVPCTSTNPTPMAGIHHLMQK